MATSIFVFLLIVSSPLYIRCAPSTFADEVPTLEPLAAPLSNVEPIHNDFVYNLNRCLRVRDEKRDLFAHGCIPDVFPNAAEVPRSSESNTILSFLSMNISVADNVINYTVNIVQEKVPMEINNIHFRIYKDRLSNDKLNQLFSAMPNTQNKGINLTLTFSRTASETIESQILTIKPSDIANEGWLDFHLEKDSFVSLYSQFNTTTVLNLKLSIHNDQIVAYGNTNATRVGRPEISLEDIGITEPLPGKEPVLIVFAHEQEEMLLQELFKNTATSKIATNGAAGATKARREVQQVINEGGSGEQASTALCGLISHTINSTAVINKNFIGHIELNYCSGRCQWPWSNNGGEFYHPVFLTVLHEDRKTEFIPPPCCVPIEYSDASLLIMEFDYAYKTHSFSNMSAQGCGCR